MPRNNAMTMLMPRLQKLKAQMQQLQALGNPMMMANQMLSTNPQLRDAMEFVKQNGNDPTAAFMALAKQQGVDPNMLITALTN